MKASYYYLLIILLLFNYACKKENRNRWVVAEVIAIDEDTGIPVRCSFTHRFLQESWGGGQYEMEYMPSTFENGVNKLSFKKNKNTSDNHLLVDAVGNYGVEGQYHDDGYLSLKKGELNTFTIYVKPY